MVLTKAPAPACTVVINAYGHAEQFTCSHHLSPVSSILPYLILSVFIYANDKQFYVCITLSFAAHFYLNITRLLHCYITVDDLEQA